MSDDRPEGVASPAPDAFFGIHIPFLSMLGVRASDWGNGKSRLELVLRPELENSLGVAHGGVICTLLDVAMATAARSEDPSSRVVTIDMTVQFMRPGKGAVVAIGKVLRLTLSLAFCEAELHDSNGKLIAKSSGTFKRVWPGRAGGDG